jgi:hypothetical protein
LQPQTRLLALRFKAPTWETKEIAKVKARLSLDYLGEAEVIKVSQAVPSALIADPSRRDSPNDNPPPESQPIADRRLAELGLSLRVDTAAVQSGITTLALEVGGPNVFLLDAQLFDADSQPWPTSFALPDQDRSWELRVVGRPKPPLSLALTVAKPGPTITVPILLEHLSPAEPKAESTKPPQIGTTPGFVAEPVSVTVSSVNFFPAGQSFLKDRSEASLLGPMITGTVISAKLFPPKDRVLQRVTEVRVTSAKDDRGRSIPLLTGAGTQRASTPANSDDSEPGSPLPVELRLGVPADDAKAIEDVTAEATIFSIGGWKEMSLTNVLADPKTPIDLSQILPGTKLVIKRVGRGRRERTIEANLDGPAAIEQLVLKIKPTGSGPAQSSFRGWRPRRGQNPQTVMTRGILVRSLEPQMSEEARNSPLTLLIRLPQDVKQGQIGFKLKPFGLL